MTIAAASAIEGMHKATALLDSTAVKVASQTRLGADTVSLSDSALALIQARIGMAANVTVFRAAIEIEKALIDVMG